jgi:hypothetical protein
MWSIGSGYSLGEPRHEPEVARVEAILAAFGPRLQLKAEISRHLKEIGRELSI